MQVSPLRVRDAVAPVEMTHLLLIER